MGVHFLLTLDSFLSDLWTSEVMIFATMKSTTATIADTISGWISKFVEMVSTVSVSFSGLSATV